MQIDPIEERSRYFCPVVPDLDGGAGALPGGIGNVSPAVPECRAREAEQGVVEGKLQRVGDTPNSAKPPRVLDLWRIEEVAGVMKGEDQDPLGVEDPNQFSQGGLATLVVRQRAETVAAARAVASTR